MNEKLIFIFHLNHFNSISHFHTRPIKQLIFLTAMFDKKSQN